MRKGDVALWLLCFTLMGMTWSFAKKLFRWDSASDAVERLVPIVENHDKQLAIITMEFETMNKHLASIDRKLGQ